MFAIVSAPHLNGSDRLTVNGLSDIVIVLAGGEKKKKKTTLQFAWKFDRWSQALVGQL